MCNISHSQIYQVNNVNNPAGIEQIVEPPDTIDPGGL